MRLLAWGVCVGSRWQTATAIPRPPLFLRGSIRYALPPLTRPTKNQQIIAALFVKTPVEIGVTWEWR
jgi:hypothetical protein